ncbi:MAG: hypothetical protein LBT96_02500 [Campylobacteraceae bacterium]|jgi:hypothetical protein|nr:hypothetical protein [Campylobacteraceae bacterium]
MKALRYACADYEDAGDRTNWIDVCTTCLLSGVSIKLAYKNENNKNKKDLDLCIAR